MKNIPGMKQAREKLLISGRQLANLDPSILAKYTDPTSCYTFGWSRGVEMLDGKPDLSKGSYYNNPQYDRPTEDEKLMADEPSFYHPNIWPDDAMPDFGDNFKAMGRMMCEVGKMIAAQCDRYISSRIASYSPHAMENMITTSKAAKGRFLNYYPLENAVTATDSNDFSSWCGWHNDHGSLTGLLPAMFFNQSGDIVPNEDPTAGKLF